MGAITAYLLARRGLQACIIHRPRKQRYKAGETLPPVANTLLQRLGISTLLQQGPHLPCPGNQSAFGSNQLTDLDFIFSPHGHGWHLDRSYFEQQLLELAKDIGVDILHNSQLRHSQYDSETNQWHLTLLSEGHEQQHQADYVVEASGITRTFLRQQNIEVQQHDKLAARIALFQTDAEKPDHRTLIEAAAEGWWYSSSTPNHQRVVMFFSDTDTEAFQNTNTSTNFLAHLQQTQFVLPKLQQQCGYLNLEKNLQLFAEPASSNRAVTVQGQQWLAVGDAAMSFDPLSSQGLWTGMQGAEIAADFISRQFEGNAKSKPYAGWIEEVYRTYLVERSKYYEMEGRWPGSKFWARRRLSVKAIRKERT